jgi:hypothetical protein
VMGTSLRVRFRWVLTGVAAVILAAVPARAGIVYACDASLAAGTCAALNGTISNLYTGVFSDVNAKIFIQMGSIGSGILGSNLSVINTATYANYRNALILDSTSANDATAVANLPNDPLPAPLPNGGVTLTNPLLRALTGVGAPVNGYTPGLASCAIGDPGCYDGVITMGDTIPWWYRSGPEAADAFDFYAVAEHETNEVLGIGGWGSCVNFPGDCGSAIGPLDLFRFTSNHNRTFSTGTNDPCTTASDTNACFSIDGGKTLLLSYNNTTSGDTGDYSTDCTQVQGYGCPNVGALDVSPTAELLELDVVGYTQVAPTPEPATVSLLSAGILGLLYARQRRK